MKIRNFVILSSLAAVCFLSGGCIGGGIVYSKSKSLEHFNLGYRGTIRPESTQSNPTEAQLNDLWGKPDSTRKSDDAIVWRYHTGIRLAGIVPMIGVGIPLVLPTGSDYTDIYLKAGTAISAYESYTSWSGGYYGLPDDRMEGCKFNKLEN